MLGGVNPAETLEMTHRWREKGGKLTERNAAATRFDGNRFLRERKKQG